MESSAMDRTVMYMRRRHLSAESSMGLARSWMSTRPPVSSTTSAPMTIRVNSWATFRAMAAWPEPKRSSINWYPVT